MSVRAVHSREVELRAAPSSGVGWRRCVACLLVLALALGTPYGVSAQGRAPSEILQEDGTLEDDATLRLQGWEVEPRGQPGSVLGGFVALLGGVLTNGIAFAALDEPLLPGATLLWPSVPWKGFGHYMANDLEPNRDMWTLLVMEGIGVGMILSGVLVWAVSKDQDTLNPIWNTLVYGGNILIASSFVFDVVGAFKGSSQELDENIRLRKGLKVQGFIRPVGGDALDLSFLWGGGVSYRTDWFWSNVETAIALGTFLRVSGDVAFRLYSWERPGNYIALGAQGRWEEFEAHQYQVGMAMPYAELSLDIGTFLPHLSQVHLVNRIGYGFEFYDYFELERDTVFADVTSIFMLETELSLNLIEELNVTALFRRRPDLLIGGLGKNGLGVLGAQIHFILSDLDIALEVNGGTAVEVWVRIAFHLLD